MCMLFSLVVVLAIAVPQSRFGVEARPSGAASCLPGPNVFPSSSPHFKASGALELLDLIIWILQQCSLPVNPTSWSCPVAPLKGSFNAYPPAPFKGFLQRLSSGTDKDLSGSFSIPAGETNAQLLESIGEGSVDGGGESGRLGVCAATVAGATHLNRRNDKTSVKTTIEIPANQVGCAFL
jgi:hypothetical protein